MKVIGITGATGAGKSVVSAELEKRGAEIIDADKIAREVSMRGGAAFDELVEEFGKEILREDGEIDRKRLGGIVFSDSARLARLNEITHRYIYAEIAKRIEDCRADFAVLDVPLLFEEGSPLKCDLTVAVTAPSDVREARIMCRDGIDRESARLRMKNQMSDSEYAAKADLVLSNDGGIERAAFLAEKIIKNLTTGAE